MQSPRMLDLIMPVLTVKNTFINYADEESDREDEATQAVQLAAPTGQAAARAALAAWRFLRGRLPQLRWREHARVELRSFVAPRQVVGHRRGRRCQLGLL